MNDENAFGPLEERLTDEAQRMLVDAGKRPLPVLQTEFLRRRRRRRLVRVVAATAAIVAVAILMRGWNAPPGQPEERIADVGELPSGADTPEWPANTLHEGTTTNERVASHSDRERPPGALVILIARVGENGETEYLPGWYVPEQVEVVDSADLSPAERAAAARLLGPEINTVSDETI